VGLEEGGPSSFVVERSMDSFLDEPVGKGLVVGSGAEEVNKSTNSDDCNISGARLENKSSGATLG